MTLVKLVLLVQKTLKFVPLDVEIILLKSIFEKNVIMVLKMGKMVNVLVNVKTSILTNLHSAEMESLILVKLVRIVQKILKSV